MTAAVGDDLPQDLVNSDIRVLTVEASTVEDSDIRSSRITHDSADGGATETDDEGGDAHE